MSSISMTGSSAMLSPRDRLQSILDSAVSSGSVSSTDETTLSGALDDIDSAMKAGADGTAKTGGHHHGGGGMKGKVDSLIDTEVNDGKLTADQATELKKLFETVHQQMAAGGPGGAGGPPPPPSADDSDSDDTVSATSATSSTSASTNLASVDSALTTLLAFVKKLEAAKADKSVYDSTGTTATAAATQSLLVDETV